MKGEEYGRKIGEELRLKTGELKKSCVNEIC